MERHLDLAGIAQINQIYGKFGCSVYRGFLIHQDAMTGRWLIAKDGVFYAPFPTFEDAKYRSTT